MRRGAGRPLALALLGAGLVLGASHPPRALPIPLAGLLPLDRATASRWCWSGAWTFPVADPMDLGAPGRGGVPGFRVNRNVGLPGAYAHQGADLANGRGGDTVRAAAHGLVVVAPSGWNGGYGNTVVLAHRRLEGGPVYSVYAHLLDGSQAVSPGEFVAAGARLGRVGRTGRATTLHLHFEVRIAGAWDQRWEKARVVDPVAFVRARLPGRPAGTTREARLIEWAEYGALAVAGADPGARIVRSSWWKMLARAARHARDQVPAKADSLRAMLEAEGLIAVPGSRESAATLPWPELAADLARLDAAGIRVPAAPQTDEELEDWCRERFGEPRPVRHLDRLAGMERVPTALDAYLLIAGAAPPPGHEAAR